MTFKELVLVVAGTALLVVVVVVSVDWSPAAVQDPARTLGLTPQGVMRWGENRDRLPFSVFELVLFLGVGVAFVAAGVAASRTQPYRNPGWLLIAAGWLWLAAGLRRSSDPLAFTAGVVLTLMYQPPLLQLVLSFPRGVLRTRAEKRFVAFFTVSWLVAAVAGWSFFDPRLHAGTGESTSRNLLLWWDSPALTSAAGHTDRVFQIGVGLVIIAMLVGRWRTGTPAYRAAFFPLWLAIIIKTSATIWVSLTAVQLVGPLTSDVLLWQYPVTAVVPFAVLFGLWRYRFARGTLGDVLVEIGGAPVSDRLVAALRRSVHDPTLTMWRWSPELGGYVDGHGTPQPLPDGDTGRAAMVLERHGTPFGALVFDETLRDQPRLLAALSSATSLALENQQMEQQLREQLEEVRRSRERIVTAGDERRRQLERDLHDGAQQRLIAVSIGLARAGRAAQSQEVRDLIEQAGADLQEALAELRELARGVYPPSLRELGLAGSVAALAERCPLPVDVQAELPYAPPPPVEVGAYFICAEAVTNAVKHAQASRIRISLHSTPTDLVAEVRDDGVGGARPGPDGGLVGMGDRAAALGGSLRVHSPRGQGTTVRTELPFAPDPVAGVP